MNPTIIYSKSWEEKENLAGGQVSPSHEYIPELFAIPIHPEMYLVFIIIMFGYHSSATY